MLCPSTKSSILLFRRICCFVCRQQPRVAAQQSTHALSVNEQDASIATEASWPQAWPDTHEQNAEPPSGKQYCKHAPGYALPGQASTHKLAQHSAAGGFILQQHGEDGPEGTPGGLHRDGYGLSTVRSDTPLQQSCQPSSNHGHDCTRGRTRQKRLASDAQQRLYKHGPVVSKSSALQRPIRRQQRPEWDDHLTSAAPQTEGGGVRVPGEGRGGFSPRPTAKELLQEALARIQNASSPRPQHSKRQRRGTAPQQGQPGPGPDQAPQQGQPGPALGHAPQLQNSQSGTGGAHLGSGHSCSADATAAQGRCPVWAVEQRPGLTVQPNKQSLVKQPAFGRKPSWVCRSSAGVSVGKYGSAAQTAAGSMHLVFFCLARLSLLSQSGEARLPLQQGHGLPCIMHDCFSIGLYEPTALHTPLTLLCISPLNPHHPPLY